MMPSILDRRWVGAAALGISFAFLAATSVLAEEPAAPAPADQAAPAEQDKAAPAGQGDAAPAAEAKPTVAEQKVPSPQGQAALIKSTLLSLSDATVTDDWSVFQATLSDDLRKVASPEKLKQSFGSTLAPIGGLSVIAGMSISPQLAVVNKGYILKMQGIIDLHKLGNLKYSLEYFMTDTGWKLASMNFINDWTLPMPDPAGQEALIRSTLSTFNDANISGNYSVLHRRLAANLRKQISAESLKDIFKSYQHVDMTAALGAPITMAAPATFDKNGVLQLVGNIKLSEKSFVGFELKYQRSDGEWKPFGIDVKHNLDPASDGWAQ